MKSLVIFLILVTGWSSLVEAGSSHIRYRRQLVPAEFRSINIDTYLNNPRSVLFQLKCLIYNGPCDRIGKFLKVTIPDLITGTCGHCSPSDRQTAGRLIAHIQKNYPKEWNDAVRKFQGGEMVKAEDVNRFENLVGVKIGPELNASTAAPPVVVPLSMNVTVSVTTPLPPTQSLSTEVTPLMSSSSTSAATTVASSAPASPLTPVTALPEEVKSIPSTVQAPAAADAVAPATVAGTA